MNQNELTGMVLSALPVGDYDKRIVILTRERGKISAFAKGARKPNSPLLAVCQPFSFGKFFLYQGKTSYNIISAEIQNYFTALREDLEAVTYGMYFCEFADYYARENLEAGDSLKLLYQSLRGLCKNTIPKVLIRYIFELKIMTVNGEGPQVFECMECGCPVSTECPYLFDSRKGGLMCKQCGTKNNLLLSPATIYTIQFIVATPIEKLFSFRVSDEVLEQLKLVTENYLSVYVERKFQAIKMLEVF
ncbi:DNA repair protein RecO [Anaeromicropila populeti]|nr:DNA repair protein RecO [Anaeromicropila populeti]